MSGDGGIAYAIVRASDRRGALRSVDLVRVDLTGGKAVTAQTLPSSARGIAIADDGASLLIASRDDLRTFRLPALSSGPLYRVLGENLGVAVVPGSSRVVVVQAKRVASVDLASTQGRDGLAFSQETVPPAPLRGLMSSAGAAGPGAKA